MSEKYNNKGLSPKEHCCKSEWDELREFNNPDIEEEIVDQKKTSGGGFKKYAKQRHKPVVSSSDDCPAMVESGGLTPDSSGAKSNIRGKKVKTPSFGGKGVFGFRD